MANILITGGNGYIGKSLTSHLSHKHQITSVGRKDFDLSSSSDTRQWFGSRYYDVVIHTAITGGHRLGTDGPDVLDNNLRMYYNLLENRVSYGRFINLGSGAELLKRDSIYGLSKHVIRTSLLNQENFYNVRVYGLFDENELPTRFIKFNLKNYIAKSPMSILQDRYMDFFYMRDFYKVIEHYINTPNVPQEYDCCYEQSPSLTDITAIINTVDTHKVGVSIVTPFLSSPYTAEYPRKILPLDYIGLEKGIHNVYHALCNQ